MPADMHVLLRTADDAGLGGCKEESLERDTLALANQADHHVRKYDLNSLFVSKSYLCGTPSYRKIEGGDL